MDWENTFSKLILDRGKTYYERGLVQNIHQWGQEYRAEVVGTVPYKVSVKMQNGRQPEMHCTCPYAAGGVRCKHMAALMYAVEGLKENRRIQEEEDKSRQVFPFAAKEEGAQPYRYFRMAKIAEKFVFSSGVLEKARKLADSGEVQLTKVEFEYEDGIRRREQMGIAWGTAFLKKVPFALSVEFDRNGILSCNCRQPGCFFNFDADYVSRWETKHGCCEHITALLLLLEDYLKKNNPGDITDDSANALFEQYRNDEVELRSDEAGVRQIVHLIPRLEIGPDEIRVAFKVGAQKTYVIKDLTAFVDAVEQKERYLLGKNASLHFLRDEFEPFSGELYSFVRKQVLAEQHRAEWGAANYRYGPTWEEIRGTIRLYGERLDDFFALAVKKKEPMEFKDLYTTKSGTIKLQDEKPKLNLTISKVEDEEGLFEGIEVEGKIPVFWEGMDSLYYRRDNTFNRVKKEDVKELSKLRKISNYDSLSFRVGRKNLTEFYHRILPNLAACMEIEEPEKEEIAAYIPPEVRFAFYLDAENNNIFCKVKAIYGEQEYFLGNWGDAKRIELRDGYREQQMMEQILDFFPERDEEGQQFSSGEDSDRVYRILDEGIDALLRWGEVNSTEKFRRLTIRRKTKLSVGVSIASDIMDLTVTSEGISQEELLAILDSYRRKKKYYRLKSGDFLNLEDPGLEEIASMLDTLRISPKELVKGKMQVPIYRAFYLDKMLEKSQGIYADRDAHFKNLVKEFKTVSDSDFELPKELRTVMRNYQATGYKWLRTLETYGFGGILADDMGLGKTLQMIAVMLAAKREKKEGTSLVVSPASLVYNWQEELNRFAPELKVCPIVGNQADRQEKIRDYGNWDVLVTSYDLLKRDVDVYEDIHFSYMVIDEAQYIKNHTTAASKSVKVVNAKHRFALTGTPIENRLSELWSIFDFLMPGFLYGYETFRKEMEIPVAKEKDEEATKRLKRMVSPFILRRKKMDVLQDLPEKMEEVRYARFEEEQQKLYDGQVVRMKGIINRQTEESFNKNKLQVLAELTKIRQICCDPELLFDNYTGESAKRQACMDLITSAIEGEHKMLVFSQFTSMLELLEYDLHKKGIAYFKITGQTPKEKRMEYVRAFNEDETPVFLISLKAGGTGLNLTGADIVIHYDPWWNLAVQSQATDRAHRIGQTKVVSVYKLIVKDTIEEKIVKMQEAKKDLAEEILSGETGGIVNMSREDLLELL